MKKELVIFFILSLMVMGLEAKIENEVTGYSFLNIENSARVFGMGSAGVSLPAGVSSIYYNPASFSFINKFEFASSYRMLFADMKYESINVGMQYRKWYVGTGLNHLHLPEFPLYKYGMERAEKLNFRNIGFNIFLSKYIFKEISAGVALKYVNYHLANDTSSAFCMDFGVLSKLSKSFNVGFSALNLGIAGKFKEAGSRDRLPIKMLAGCSYQYKDYLLYSQQVGVEFPSYFLLNSGVEFLPEFFIRPRTGIIYNKNNIDYTLGAGINFDFESYNFDINYDLNPSSVLSINHLFELKISKARIIPLTEKEKNKLKVELHFKNADMYVKSNDYENAKNELVSVIQLMSNNKFAYYELGKIYYKQENHATALENIRIALMIDDDFNEAVEIEKMIISKAEKETPVWLKQDTFNAKAKLVYDDFEYEGKMPKFAAESGVFERIIAEDRKYGKWSFEFKTNDMILQTSIRLPDLSRFSGIIISLSSTNISEINIELIEQSRMAERKWEVPVPGLIKEFQEMVIPFRNFSVEGQPNAVIDLTKIHQINIVVNPEFIKGDAKESWIGIDYIKFYK